MRFLILVAISLSIAAGQGAAIEQAEQRAASAPKGPTPRTRDGKPDLSGLWTPDRNFIYDIQDALTPGEKLPLQPWALKTAQERQSKDDPEALCLPTGVPRQAPYPWRIMQNAEMMFFLFEGNIHSYRQIFLTNPKHPEDWNPNWYGHSSAKWEGDTLVIDTVGFVGFAGTPGGGRRGPTTHLVERYNIVDNGERLTVTFTWNDPSIYTKPHTYTLNYYKMPRDVYAFEDPCDSGDPKEYQSVQGIPVIGATSVYEQNNQPANGGAARPAQAPPAR